MVQNKTKLNNPQVKAVLTCVNTTKPQVKRLKKIFKLFFINPKFANPQVTPQV